MFYKILLNKLMINYFFKKLIKNIALAIKKYCKIKMNKAYKHFCNF